MKKNRGMDVFGEAGVNGGDAVAAVPAALAALALMLAMLTGCVGSRQVRAAPSAVDTDQTTAEETVEIDSAQIARERAADLAERFGIAQDHFILARDYERRGMQDMAEQLYQTAYDFWPKPGFLRNALLEKHTRAEAFDKALELFFREGETYADMPPEDRRAIGLIYLRLGDIAKASEAMESLGGSMTDDEMYSLAQLYRSAGREDMAAESFRRFFGVGRSAAVGIRMVQMSIGERKIAEAESLASILYEAYPKNAEVVTLFGMVRQMAGDISAAARLYDEALAIDSTNEETLRSLAQINVLGERYAEAAGYYRRLIAKGSDGLPYRRGLAFLLFHLKEYEESGALLDTLIREGDARELHELHAYRGLIHTQTKEYAKAAEQFKAAIALDSLNADHWRELCYSYILAKDTANARASVDRYIARFPRTGVGRRLSGYVYDFQKKHAEAAAEFRKAVEIDSADYFSWFHLGASLERQKRIDEAAEAFRAALRIKPGDGDASNYLGYMWADAGINLDSAKTLIEAALKADSLNGAYLDSYAWVFYRTGDYRQALYYMNKALERDDIKNDPVPYEHLGDIQFKLEDYRAAEAAYKKALELKTEEVARIKARLEEIRRILRSGR